MLASGGAGGHDCQKEHEECVERGEVLEEKELAIPS